LAARLPRTARLQRQRRDAEGILGAVEILLHKIPRVIGA
jgi:hypothetical protein